MDMIRLKNTYIRKDAIVGVRSDWKDLMGRKAIMIFTAGDVGHPFIFGYNTTEDSAEEEKYRADLERLGNELGVMLEVPS